MGLLMLVDPETGRRRGPDEERELQARFAEAAANQRSAIAGAIRGAGVDHVQLRTDRDWLQDIVRFVVARRRRRAGRPPAAAMNFLAPGRLWLLVVVVALAAAYVVVQRRRRHYAARFTNLDLLASVAPKRPGWRRRRRRRHAGGARRARRGVAAPDASRACPPNGQR